MTGNRPSHLASETDAILQRLGVARQLYQDGPRLIRSPLTGEPIANVRDADAVAVREAINIAESAFLRLLQPFDWPRTNAYKTQPASIPFSCCVRGSNLLVFSYVANVSKRIMRSVRLKGPTQCGRELRSLFDMFQVHDELDAWREASVSFP